MVESYEVIKEAVDKIGAKKAAAEMKVSTSLIYKWCEESGGEDAEDKSGAKNPLDRINALFNATEDIKLIDWLANKADGFFVKNSTLAGSDNIDSAYVVQTQQIIREFSEAKRLRKEWQDLKSYGETFITACEKGTFRG
ncbi:MAG: hypothetical protein ACYTFY_14070 [Planctomycetota bacterium]|jgi:hypothetical protein